MKKIFVPINNQNGSMILIAMMLLVILTIMGITSTSTSVVENRIATNNQLHKMAFYTADSGIHTTAKIISLAYDEYDPIDGQFEVEYLWDDNDDFWEKVAQTREGLLENFDKENDLFIRYTHENGTVETTVFLVTEGDGTTGSGRMFTGGVGGSGAEAEEFRVFRIISEGTSHRNSATLLSADFLKVIGGYGL